MALAIIASRAKDPTYLLSIRQGPSESLRRYVDHLKNAILELHDTPIDMVVTTLMQGTTFTPLRESLAFD